VLSGGAAEKQGAAGGCFLPPTTVMDWLFAVDIP
jgi:hypothetical protein